MVDCRCNLSHVGGKLLPLLHHIYVCRIREFAGGRIIVCCQDFRIYHSLVHGSKVMKDRPLVLKTFCDGVLIAGSLQLVQHVDELIPGGGNLQVVLLEDPLVVEECLTVLRPRDRHDLSVEGEGSYADICNGVAPLRILLEGGGKIHHVSGIDHLLSEGSGPG